jgi:predicted metalloendopeptidase
MKRKYYINAHIAEERDDGEDDVSEEEEESDVAMLAYNLYMKEVVVELIKKADPSYRINDNLNRISRLIQVSVNISKSIYTFIEMAENASKAEDRDGNLSDLVYIKLKDLHREVFDETVDEQREPLFEKYMKLMLNGIPEAHFDVDGDVVLTSNADIMYLRNVIKMINDTKPIYLEAFLWWSIVEELILYSHSSMRNLYYDYTKVITGVEGVQSRSSYCTMSINKLMGYAVSFLIVEQDFIQETKPNVEKMLSNIISSFSNIIYHSWMDFQTKKRSLTKLQKMKSLIGFPEWILNKTELEMHYKGVRREYKCLCLSLTIKLSHFSSALPHNSPHVILTDMYVTQILLTLPLSLSFSLSLSSLLFMYHLLVYVFMSSD